MDELERAVVSEVEGRRADIVALLAELIAQPSVAATGSSDAEAAIQGLLAQRLGRAGFRTDLWEPDAIELPLENAWFGGVESFAGRPQLIARRPGAGAGKALLLNGHIDVVDPGERGRWTSDPFEATLRDGQVIGRGAADMKGGVAAMVVAAETISELGIELAGDLIVNSVTDEESTGAGSIASIARGLGADAALIPEPTSLALWLGARGSQRVTIEVRGRAGHAGLNQPHWSARGAVNAVEKSAPILAALSNLTAEWRSRHARSHRHLAAGGVVVTDVHADGWVVSHPDRLRIGCHVQYLPAQADRVGHGSTVRAELERAIEAAASADAWLRENPPRVSWAGDVPPALVDDESEVVRAATDALCELGRAPRIEPEATCFDGPTLTRAGIPAIALGPGDILDAHAPDERVSVDELVSAAQAIALTALRFCGPVASAGRRSAGDRQVPVA